MKKILTLTLATSFLSIASAQDQTEINIPQINQVIKETIDSTFESDDLINGLFLRLDETKTNLDSQTPRVAISLGGNTTQTPWNKTLPSKFSVNADLHVTESNYAKAELGAGVKTQTLDLISYLSKNYLKDFEGHIEDNRILEIIARLQNTTHLSQVFSALVDLKAIFAETHPEEAANILILSSLENNNIVNILVKYTHKDEIMYGIEDLTVSTNINNQKISASIGLGFEFYDDISSIVESAKNYLLAIQNRDETLLGYIQTLMESVRDSLADLINGDN